ncbi:MULTISPECIES: YidH family protein [Citrobacter]|uniref:YidH family protein n=1 Tax=Citrobacter TaxID=544 RepID=UPI0026C70158
MKISRLGEAPDYRFSLANERTFLAWIRTALGFLAAGVGLDQLAPDFAMPSFVNSWRYCCVCLPVVWRFMAICAGAET